MRFKTGIVAVTQTRLKIKEKSQHNNTGPSNQIKLIHGELYMKSVSTASSFMGGRRLTGCTIYESVDFRGGGRNVHSPSMYDIFLPERVYYW